MFMTNLSASQYRQLTNKVSNQRRLVPGYETQLMRRLAPRTWGTQLTPHPGPYFPIGKPFRLSPSVLQLRTILHTTFSQLYEIHQCRILAYLYTLWSPPRSNTQRWIFSCFLFHSGVKMHILVHTTVSSLIWFLMYLHLTLGWLFLLMKEVSTWSAFTDI